jgi:peptidoglycan hydrolase CwlO-like protein
MLPLLCALAIATSVVFVARPVAADQVSTLKSQAVAISEQLVHQELQVATYQQRYAVESAAVTRDAQSIEQTTTQVSRDEQQIAGDRNRVRAQAVALYMNAGTDASGQFEAVFDADADTSLVRSEYRGIAVGNITTTVDQLHTDQTGLQAHQAVLLAQQTQDQVAQTQAGTALHDATGAQAQLRAEQAQVTGELAAAVAQQAAAQAQAAAAAVRAAQQAALHAATGGGTAPVASGGLVDPVLNPFLQCVVQRESHGNYGAVSPGGQYRGAFQFSQSTWNMAARAAGLPNLVGVLPNLASKAEQDTVAVTLYSLDGGQPWGGSCG